MKRLTNANARDLQHAIALAGDARRGGRAVAFAGGGSDLLGMVKDRLITPDLVVRLATVRNPTRRQHPPAAHGRGPDA
jgi:CO/xanthine dehydrogenase FAD-binding subunit